MVSEADNETTDSHRHAVDMDLSSLFESQSLAATRLCKEELFFLRRGYQTQKRMMKSSSDQLVGEVVMFALQNA